MRTDDDREAPCMDEDLFLIFGRWRRHIRLIRALDNASFSHQSIYVISGLNYSCTCYTFVNFYILESPWLSRTSNLRSTRPWYINAYILLESIVSRGVVLFGMRKKWKILQKIIVWLSSETAWVEPSLRAEQLMGIELKPYVRAYVVSQLVSRGLL